MVVSMLCETMIRELCKCLSWVSVYCSVVHDRDGSLFIIAIKKVQYYSIVYHSILNTLYWKLGNLMSRYNVVTLAAQCGLVSTWSL